MGRPSLQLAKTACTRCAHHEIINSLRKEQAQIKLFQISF